MWLGQHHSGTGRPVLRSRGFDNLTQDRSIPMTDQAISPLRRRMIEDMAIRKFAPKTQHDYVQRVKDFAAFLGRSPDTAKSEEVRGFRLHLASSGAGTPKINATVSALRFFFNVTLDRPDLAKHLSFMREPRKVPVVLSPEGWLFPGQNPANPMTTRQLTRA